MGESDNNNNKSNNESNNNNLRITVNWITTDCAGDEVAWYERQSTGNLPEVDRTRSRRGCGICPLQSINQYINLQFDLLPLLLEDAIPIK